MTPASGGREAGPDRLRARVAALVDRLAGGDRDDAARDGLIAELCAWQREHVEVLGRIAASAAGGTTQPAVPTDVFRFARVASHAPEEDVRVFRTSGTTSGARGAHHLRDLSLYDRAARTAARYALFPDVARMLLVILAPAETEAPESSLSYMLARFVEWFGAPGSVVAWRRGALDLDALAVTLARAERDAIPAGFLGTSLAFAHAEEALGARRFRLPPGSRLVHTGGFKGRTREVDPAALGANLSARYGIHPEWIVQEYGMTELSSQLYEVVPRRDRDGNRTRCFWVPGWVRATVVDPETLAPLPEGTVGLLRVDDLANVDTACAVQTSDLARAVDGGIVLLGRAPGATPRGCSLAMHAVRLVTQVTD